MTRLCERANRLSELVRRCLLAIVASEGLFLAMQILFYDVLNTDVFMAKAHILSPVRTYVMMPWTGALLGIYLAREKKKIGLDTGLLVLLELWLIVPFVMRFGTENATMNAAYGYAMSFFILYASVRESDTARRARQLDIACAGFSLLSIVVGGMLLYCVATGKTYCSYWDTIHFGMVNGQLWHGRHYNVTAMLAQVCMMMSVVGVCRSKRIPAALLHLLGAIIMALAVVLTQSRTSRYAMLAVFALGTWNGMAEYLPIRCKWLRQGAAIVCAMFVLVGGYKLCGVITNVALAHHAGQPTQVLEVMLPSAIAEEGQEAEQAAQVEARDQKPDATFSDRTNIWKNVFKNWKNNPKHMLIGNGMSRSQFLNAKGTIHESVGAVGAHNAYLQFASDFGWIGFGLMALFMLSVVPSAWRVFFAHGEKRVPGGCALCMLVIAILATGMMEDAPLEPMTTMNRVLFFALAQIQGMGNDLKKAK